MRYTKFKLNHRILATVLTIIFSFSFVWAQKIMMKGVVKDAASGEPILGANIVEKGTTNGTITNLDGEFSLSVSAKSTIVIKYVGYLAQEIVVGNQKNIVVSLKEDAISLGEVVAIGYATVKKNDATGSITAIKPDEMNKGLTTNAQDMIVGKVAGVSVTSNGGTPGGGATIRIRGGSSISASNDPLIVIDGLAMDNDGIKGVSNFLSTINPNDIESFTVLKDASATAIYGSRASNGVIIITTKKGKKDSKPKVSYNGNLSVGSVGKTIDVMTGDQFRDYVNQLYAGQTDVLGKLGTANTDWQSQIYQTSISHDHNISVSGGIKNMPYRVSAGYTNQNGIIKTSNFERYTGSISLSPTFFDDHLKLNVNAKGMLVNNRFADTGVIGSAVSMDPTQSVYSSEEPYATTFGGYWQWITSGTTWNTLSVANPVATLMLKKDESHAKDFIGNVEADYKVHFLPDLRLHLNMGIDASSGKQTLYTPTTNASDNQLGRKGYEKQGKTNKSFTFFANYTKDLDKIQNIDVMAGYEWQHFYRDGNYAYTALDGVTNPSSLTYKTESYLVSFFGRANYSLLDKYLLTATVRDDGSSRFSAKNRWGLFPSFAFAWKMKDESFLANLNTLTELKLRLGYGVTGQQNITNNNYAYLPVYSSNVEGAYYPFGSTYYGIWRPDAYNENLKWEQTATYNAGIDWGFFNNRLSGSIDAYYRLTTDLINTSAPVAAGTNFKNLVIQNIGSLYNKGFEFTVTGRPVVQKDVSWELNYNLTYNQNKVTKLSSNSAAIMPTGGISSGTGNTIQAFAVGYPSFSYYVYEQVYNTNGKPIEGLYVDRNGDGIINDDDRYFYHNPMADVTMGLTSKLTYKNFDLGITLRASLGNYVYNDVAANRANVGESGVWSTSGFFVNKPMSSFETNFTGKTNWYFSDYYIQNASFVRCDNITLGYSFKNLFHVIPSGRISAAVQNPFVITNYKGLDPEIYGGIDNNIYPRPIMTVVGLSLNF